MEDDHAYAALGLTPDAVAKMIVLSVASAFMHAYEHNLSSELLCFS